MWKSLRGAFNKTFVFLNSGEPIPRGRKTAEIALIMSGKFVIPFPEQQGCIMGKAAARAWLRSGVASNKSKGLKNQGDERRVPERRVNIFEHLSSSPKGFSKKTSLTRDNEKRREIAANAIPRLCFYFQSFSKSSSALPSAAFILFSKMAFIYAISQSYCFFSFFLRSSSLWLICFSPPPESAHS